MAAEQNPKLLPYRGDKLQRQLTTVELYLINQQKRIALSRMVSRQEMREKLDRQTI